MGYLYLNRCIARVCCKSARHWLTAAPLQLHTDNRWVWRRPAVVFQMPDTVIAYITHDDRPNISSVSSRHVASLRAGLRRVTPELTGSILGCHESL